MSCFALIKPHLTASNSARKKAIASFSVFKSFTMLSNDVFNLFSVLKEKRNQLDYEKLSEVKGLAYMQDSKLKFTGYGETLKGCNLNFPDFDWLKSGLNGDEKALKNYFRPFDKVEELIMDERSFRKGQKPMVVNVFTSKGCVAKCTFCQRGSLGYLTYDLGKMEEHLKHCRDNYDIGFLTITDENFGSNKKYTYQLAELFNKYNM